MKLLIFTKARAFVQKNKNILDENKGTLKEKLRGGLFTSGGREAGGRGWARTISCFPDFFYIRLFFSMGRTKLSGRGRRWVPAGDERLWLYKNLSRCPGE